jgi:hypothetical protein
VNIVVGVIAGVVVLAAFGLLAVAFAAARSLVVGRPAQNITYNRVGDHLEFASTELTRAEGSYGLLALDGVHARIDAVLDEQGTTVTRRLGTVTGGLLPTRGEGRWVRDVYPTPAELGLSFTEVAIATAGGPSPAWLIPGSVGDDVWAIHLHGIRTTRSVVLPGASALLLSSLRGAATRRDRRLSAAVHRSAKRNGVTSRRRSSSPWRPAPDRSFSSAGRWER